MPDPGAMLAERAAALLPAGCFTASADPARNWPLWPAEDCVGMVPGRAAEFSAGRHAARLALALAGCPVASIPKGADRAPVWPAGVRGSISHSDQACVAAVSTVLRGIGLDLEPLRGLEAELAALICGAEDRVEAQLAADPALMIFCAKEASYKAQYPLTKRIFGPDALAVHIRGEVFRAVFQEDIAPFARGDGITGRITLCAGHVLAVAWISS